MKQIMMIITALVFTLSLAGLSFSQEMQNMNHAGHGCNMSACGSCCNQKNDTQAKKTDYTTQKKVIDLVPSETPQ